MDKHLLEIRATSKRDLEAAQRGQKVAAEARAATEAAAAETAKASREAAADDASGTKAAGETKDSESDEEDQTPEQFAFHQSKYHEQVKHHQHNVEQAQIMFKEASKAGKSQICKTQAADRAKELDRHKHLQAAHAEKNKNRVSPC